MAATAPLIDNFLSKGPCGMQTSGFLFWKEKFPSCIGLLHQSGNFFFFLFVEGTERDDKTCSDLGCLGIIINNDLLS